MPAEALKSVTNVGWAAGLRNMLRKENAKWWSWKALAVQLIVWTVIINSLVALALFVIPYMPIPDEANGAGDAGALPAPEVTLQTIFQSGLTMFFRISGIALMIGGTIIAHDAILKERETGTAAWLLSKPLSRKAFVLAKIVANAVGLLVIVIAVQATVAYVQISFAYGSPAPIAPFLGGLGILSLGGLFYMVLALSLGAFTLSRGATLGLPILIGIAGGIILPLVDVLKYVTPWALGEMAQAVALGLPLPGWAAIPIVVTAAWILVFGGAAVWKFERIEL